ncbi:MAG: FHA domain-containing protein [Thermoanaerobaculia bacterium]
MASDLTGGTLLYRAEGKKNFRVPERPEMSLGADRSNDIAVAFPGVSRRHARILWDGKNFWVEDAGSSNGTFLNGRRLRRRERLDHLDVVTLGRNTDLIFVRRRVEPRRIARRGIRAASLEPLDGVEAGTRREVPRGSITLGRSPSNNVVADSQAVSKIHARLERGSLQLLLIDLNSSNGTFVGRERIEIRVLQDGDEINLGGARRYRVHLEEGEVETSDVVSTAERSSRTSRPLPIEWKTRIEWTTAERVMFDEARGGRRVPDTAKQDAVAVPAPEPPKAAAPEPAARPAPGKPAPGRGPVRLVLEGKAHKFELPLGDHEVGRVSAAAIHIDSPTISRRHAVLRVRETETTVEDLGSANGTLVNMVRLSAPHRLQPGDVVHFGAVAFRARFPSGEKS